MSRASASTVTLSTILSWSIPECGNGRRGHPLLPSTGLFFFFPYPIFLPPTQAITLPFICLPLLFLLQPFQLVFLTFSLALLSFNHTTHLDFFLLLSVKRITLRVVTSRAQCSGHFVEFGLFGGSNAMRIRWF